MKKKTDCLLIGHNNIEFTRYENMIKKMGTDSEAYRNLDLNYLFYKKKSTPISELFNSLIREKELCQKSIEPLEFNETFSLTIAYLGSYLNRHGFTFDYIHSFQDEKEELSRKLAEDNILTVAIITTFYIWEYPIIEIVEFVRKYSLPVKIIIGGPFIFNQYHAGDSFSLNSLFKTMGADFYVIGTQGESTLKDIITALKGKTDFSQLNNIFYKNGDRYLSTPLIKEENKLSNNMINWGLFSDRVEKYLNVRTSVSCPFSCAFCGFPKYAGQYQTMGIIDIRKDLDSINDLNSVEIIHFIDDTFNIPVKRFKEFLKTLIKSEYPFKWNSFFKCQSYDKEMVEMMKESGCQGVFLGIESGSSDILKNMKKHSHLDDYYNAISLFKELDIVTYGSFILGFPGETLESVSETTQLIEESGLDFYQWKVWYFTRIAPIFSVKETYNIEGLHYEWSHHTMNSKEASDLVEEQFFQIKNSIRVPDYGFDFPNIFHLLNRGLNITQIKHFLNYFNRGVQEKMIARTNDELSRDLEKKLIHSLLDQEFDASSKNNSNHGHELDIDFDL